MKTKMEDVPTSGSKGDTTADVLPTGVTTIEGQPSATASNQFHDPLLAIMPDFAFSMPAQIVVDGINLALVTILAIHLSFTTQYHRPLSKKNFYLQTTSTLMLLINLAVHLHTVLHRLEVESRSWPYMFAYIGVQIPPQDGSWNTAQEAFYLLMQAITTALVHLTHIQFLTLLYPSALEARLILWMLGPLALVASGMEFTALSSDDDVKTSDLGDAIRNICNSTLFLLYTSALLIWGLFVNRRRAWRTDGGTAAFGGGSVGLAFINTSISFVEIAFDRLWWLPSICWTLTIWQSWLGFWWWVGSGMGIGEVEDRAERQERKRKREEKLRRKREREERNRLKLEAAAANGGSSFGDASDHVFGGIKRFRDKLAVETKDAGHTLNRRLRRTTAAGATNAPAGGDEEEIELASVRAVAPPDDAPIGAGASSPENRRSSAARPGTGEQELTSVSVVDGSGREEVATNIGSGSQSSDTHPTMTTNNNNNNQGYLPGWVGSVADYVSRNQPDFIKRRMRRLRLAHVAAARRAATEQTALRDQVLNRQARAEAAPGLRSMMFEREITRSGGNGPIEEGSAFQKDGPSADPTDSNTADVNGSDDDGEEVGEETEEEYERRRRRERRRNNASSSSRRGSATSRSQRGAGSTMSPGRSSSFVGSRSPAAMRSPSLRAVDRQRPIESSSSPYLGAAADGLGIAASRISVDGGNLFSPLQTPTSSDPLNLADSTAAGVRSPLTQSSSQVATSPRAAVTAAEDEWEDEEDEENSSTVRGAGPSTIRGDRPSRDADASAAAASSSSWAWRGGLKGLRMRDRTSYD
ncbi:hypothetical protein FA10DRAFT_274617 [Acaromyces ingoldii]|uniref:Uncharacterized protein n=1 Tax=Acaromyces ingoldii TaxID=215250 RepID=A0A316YVN1_9BASI|nr:hypothetical protein FA10DRAFT_274617 [Acaromyces ingoldii]PWN91815.1 hypothetical protein FA10DRAFT_274617 [Acaromyces ingoldii]